MSATGEKTEQPTPKRLRDAREKGQVAYSRDVSSAAVMIAVFIYVGATFEYSMDEWRDLVTYITTLDTPFFGDAVNAALVACALTMAKLSIPPVAVAAVSGFAAGYFQVGALMSWEAVKPDLNKLNPIQGLKKIFSKKNLVEFLKNVIKLTFIGYLIYDVIVNSIPDLVTFSYGESDQIIPALGTLVKRIAVNTAIALVVIAAFDAFFQRRNHIKQLMMTKDEVKQEYKEMEGSPEIKSRRRELQRELLSGDVRAGTKKASAVVTNPIHVAVALHYEKGKTKLPVITAKGDGVMASLMRTIALENNIPIFENIPLARALYANTEVDDYIPSDLIEPVAEILRWAQEIQAQK